MRACDACLSVFNIMFVIMMMTMAMVLSSTITPTVLILVATAAATAADQQLQDVAFDAPLSLDGDKVTSTRSSRADDDDAFSKPGSEDAIFRKSD